MDVKTAGDNILYQYGITAQDILLVLVCDKDNICWKVRLPVE